MAAPEAAALFVTGSQDSAESSGIIGGAIKTTESDPLTSAVNVGDYFYYSSTDESTFNDSVTWTPARKPTPPSATVPP